MSMGSYQYLDLNAANLTHFEFGLFRALGGVVAFLGK